MNKKNTVIGVLVIIILALAVIAFIPKNNGNVVLAPGNSSDENATLNNDRDMNENTESPVQTNGGNNEEEEEEEANSSATLDDDMIEEIFVIYTKEGFNPKSITVNKGQTVRFINESATPMSVASNDHPTHNIYPEFDQYKTDARGKSVFDFTFDKTGEWQYHNHLQANHEGTVIVK
ncbi:MAG: hypothetical protein A3G52_03755 [Candidatus Taylorbacteria bacterium RIFCSPLOWO2_12_FULL_43_20]|uniref:EfeO-type cupredoxin-like domain-containing protein n=1 Tax=Candidatus Taylorbacteria bacterium RIFCSPLOWO2_12_FULL_43_20 TaxID=1802332 RepID=A0A1G2P1X5_9BACT|nr:MAG: hypothetical protein A2825_00695 [Candidatus Taylorbacteria bacterium RIFCSPHIGHO2_01_FULL_43_120]OHA22865.1 MAG: hypothetical protein A3B98_01570 [Candidatus Taylorbacteria bacterium RIFCSPHIGHO2_02_FULL_43_55]OHA29352.1 MAG: hypothetical protein A3E92_02325 [Candidatus Taylorbacteria bacterium RIFCSPHIGHO2_12_FULL_42_34]OHA31729.1 MAG: hypothetical protein A3B09_01770 [Candidatus Taylorbacteria bacterium RIFCSPLOWO2_01_FULL_43_83]OHA38780.1 MAG: hypothetical protein A3H58_01880 [Candi